MDWLNESSNASLLIKSCATADGICKPPEQPTDIRCQHRFWRNKTQSRMGIRNSEHLLLCGRRCAHFQEKRFPWILQQHKRAQQSFEAQRGTLQNSWWDVPPSSANLNPDSSLDLNVPFYKPVFKPDLQNLNPKTLPLSDMSSESSSQFTHYHVREKSTYCLPTFYYLLLFDTEGRVRQYSYTPSWIPWKRYPISVQPWLYNTVITATVPLHEELQLVPLKTEAVYQEPQN